MLMIMLLIKYSIVYIIVKYALIFYIKLAGVFILLSKFYYMVCKRGKKI